MREKTFEYVNTLLELHQRIRVPKSLLSKRLGNLAENWGVGSGMRLKDLLFVRTKSQT